MVSGRGSSCVRLKCDCLWDSAFDSWLLCVLLGGIRSLSASMREGVPSAIVTVADDGKHGSATSLSSLSQEEREVGPHLRSADGLGNALLEHVHVLASPPQN